MLAGRARGEAAGLGPRRRGGEFIPLTGKGVGTTSPVVAPSPAAVSPAPPLPADKAMEEVFGAQYVSLHVRVTNKVAVHLYTQTLGYQ